MLREQLESTLHDNGVHDRLSDLISKEKYFRLNVYINGNPSSFTYSQ